MADAFVISICYARTNYGELKLEWCLYFIYNLSVSMLLKFGHSSWLHIVQLFKWKREKKEVRGRKTISYYSLDEAWHYSDIKLYNSAILKLRECRDKIFGFLVVQRLIECIRTGLFTKTIHSWWSFSLFFGYT